jgi:hypothetical protein
MATRIYITLKSNSDIYVFCHSCYSHQISISLSFSFNDGKTGNNFFMLRLRFITRAGKKSASSM